MSVSTVKLPLWFRQEIPDKIVLEKIRLLNQFDINTVCQSAKCPNLNRCFSNSELTFMILGNICTRHCRFCAVDKADSRLLALDSDEPYRIAEAVKILGLEYVVITSVTRDDLKDGGAGTFAQVITHVHSLDTNIKVEVLIPDFAGNMSALRRVLEAGPDIIGHNIETVRRLYADLRPEADYNRSLQLLSRIKNLYPQMPVKSSMMLGLGETETEVAEAISDLKANKCDVLILGQYLAPSDGHYPVKEFIAPEQFVKYKDIAEKIGFKTVLAAPLARSSYKAAKIYEEITDCKSQITNNIQYQMSETTN